MGKTIGIDLGTTNSAMAVLTGGEPEVIPNAEGGRTTPSVVAFTTGGERLVGAVARRQAVTNPQNTVFSVKRFMGRAFSEVNEEMTIVPYEVIPGPSGDVRIKAGEKEWSPPEVSAMILQKLKADAEAYLGEPVDGAVITVPAYFNDAQRQATKDAGTIAGLEVKRIINEPTAAALAYGLDKETERTILVFDLGGGTFDVSILEIGDGVFQVKSTNGDNHLGGDNFDKAVVDWMVAEFKQSHDLLQRLEGPTKQALEDAGVTGKDIEHVVLVGGMSRMPAVQDRVTELTGKEPHRGVNPDEVVAVGAAIQAGVLAGEVKDVLLLDVTPLSLGIETKGGVFTRLIERNTTIPTKKSEVFSTAEDNQNQVEIHVLQGEREMASFNRTLGRFSLTGIPPAPRGVPQVEVTFDIDANGIVHVSAKDRGTGIEQTIEIKSSSGLSDDEVKQMVNEAESHADEDKRLRRLADARNQAEARVHEAERQLKDHGDSVDAELKAEIEAAVEGTKTVQEGEDPEAIEAATEVLTQALHKMSEQVYQRAAAEQQTADGGDETVEDADYEVIDEDDTADKA